MQDSAIIVGGRGGYGREVGGRRGANMRESFAKEGVRECDGEESGGKG